MSPAWMGRVAPSASTTYSPLPCSTVHLRSQKHFGEQHVILTGKLFSARVLPSRMPVRWEALSRSHRPGDYGSFRAQGDDGSDWCGIDFIRLQVLLHAKEALLNDLRTERTRHKSEGEKCARSH